MVKVVIIEDELDIREINRRLLESNFNDVEIVGETDSVEGGIDLIQRLKPHLVLMDIEIIGGTGFDILQKVKPYDFKLVVVTAFNQFAIKAIKFSAIDYILKPINESEFITAVQNALEIIGSSHSEQQVANFIDIYERKTQVKKIVLRTNKAVHIVDISDIVYCNSDNSYTYFYLSNEERIMVSKSIKEFAEILEEYNFFRPHQSYLINLNAVKLIDKADGGFVILKNGSEIPISSRRKQIIFQMLNHL